MKRTLFLVWILVVIMLFVPACKKKVKPPAAGKATAPDMVRMLPENPLMIISFDMHKFTALPLFDKLIAESEKTENKESGPFRNYQDFVYKTGIDPKKDVFCLTFGLYGNLEQASEADVLGVVNLNYDRERILKLLKDNQVELAEEAYEGNSIYSVKESQAREKSKEFCFAFLDKANVMFGTPGKMKAGLDLFKGKGVNALSAGKTEKYLGKINTRAIVWLLLGNIPESVKKQASAGGSPMGVDLSKSEALVGFFDYESNALKGELQLLGSDEKSNKKIADNLNGLKVMGAAFAKEEPAAGEVINAITISASSDAVKLSFTLPEELLNKLAEKAKAKAVPEMPQAEEPKTEE